MNESRSLVGRADAERRLSAGSAALLAAVLGGLAVACGSSTRTDLYGDSEHPARSAGAARGHTNPDGIGANGSGDHGGSTGAGGSGSGSAAAVGGAGTTPGSGSSGATNVGTAGGSTGVADAGSSGGDPGVGGAGGDPGIGGAVPGGATGSGGADNGGSGPDGGSGGSPSRPQCVTKASQTVLIGDSYVNWTTHTFQADLTRAGEPSRIYAIGGASMATGGITTLIPDQFENGVKADKDIRVVVMDGGGNDILVPAATWIGGGNCKNSANAPNLPVCQQIVQASLDREQVLWKRMADVGIRDLIFFFYPTVPNNTVLGGANPNAIAAWARPKVKAGCDAAYDNTGQRLRCHFVDMVPVFQGHPEYFTTGDIHPNTTGSAAMAKAVWQTMTDACVGQNASSGCCEP